jgi:integrase
MVHLAVYQADPWYGLWVFLAFTGVRRGEALGLRWPDVDVVARTISIRTTLVCADHRAVVGEPKTARGRRTIAVDDRVVRVLERRWAQAGANHQSEDFVFRREDGRPLNPEMVTRWFGVAVRRAGLRPVRLHDLRHLHATLALAAGVDTRIVSGRLDHATTAFTADVYQHLLPGMDRDAAESISRLVAEEENGARPSG